MVVFSEGMEDRAETSAASAVPTREIQQSSLRLETPRHRMAAAEREAALLARESRL
jgi:hypothetical protein